METIGIIAEYNPFHNGHLYMIEEAKRITGAKHVAVVMSGDFVQCGSPAWTDKYLRTGMALVAGVDVVFELPVCYATASAERFALAGAGLLTALGIVDGICFGSESGDLGMLMAAADFLANPPACFAEGIRTLTAQGLSYPAARAQLLPKDWRELVGRPNDLLGVEYLKAFKLLGSGIKPVAIQRRGAGYHDTEISGEQASASAIRRMARGEADQGRLLDGLAGWIPENCRLLLQESSRRFPIWEEDFAELVYYRLACLGEEDLGILDMSSELYQRIKKSLGGYRDVPGFIHRLKTRQYTYSRISRVLFHALLDIRKGDVMGREEILPAVSVTPYARLLGFRKESSHLIRRVKALPVITKPADGRAGLEAFYKGQEEVLRYAGRLLERDYFAANLYRQVQQAKAGEALPAEEQQGPVIWDE